MLAAKNKILPRLRVIQSLQTYRLAISHLHNERVVNALDGNISRDENGRAYGVNDNELHLIGKLLSRLLHEIDSFAGTMDYAKWRLMIHDRCASLDKRIEQLYPHTREVLRHSHRH